MDNDLVKRLRDSRYDGQLMMRAEAADRIEALQERLSLCIRAIEAQDALKDRITMLEGALKGTKYD